MVNHVVPWVKLPVLASALKSYTILGNSLNFALVSLAVKWDLIMLPLLEGYCENSMSLYR